MACLDIYAFPGKCDFYQARERVKRWTMPSKMLDAIQDKLGIENEADRELADLEMETRPEDVLAEIDRLQQRMK